VFKRDLRWVGLMVSRYHFACVGLLDMLESEEL
jgi:hypothetical protein